MTDMRNQLIDTMAKYLPHPSDDEYAEAADAIIAALPGMVKPLAWYQTNSTTGWRADAPTGRYEVDSVGVASFYAAMWRKLIFLCDEGDEDSAKAAAQAHYVAASLEPFGVQGVDT